jgi:hypothetical protein
MHLRSGAVSCVMRFDKPRRHSLVASSLYVTHTAADTLLLLLRCCYTMYVVSVYTTVCRELCV